MIRYVVIGCGISLLANPSCAQEPSPLATATAMQRLVVDAIERAEGSVVAISRLRRDPAQPAAADASGPPRLSGLDVADPTAHLFAK